MSNKFSRFALPVIAAVALAFGVATILSGGRVLFGDAAARAAAGHYVPFVVWFNFLAGFAYIVGAVGLALRRAWAARIALVIAAATALVFLIFGLLVLAGQPFESRTVAAMILRTTLWTGIAWFACRSLGGCMRRPSD